MGKPDFIIQYGDLQRFYNDAPITERDKPTMRYVSHSYAGDELPKTYREYAFRSFCLLHYPENSLAIDDSNELELVDDLAEKELTALIYAEPVRFGKRAATSVEWVYLVDEKDRVVLNTRVPRWFPNLHRGKE